MVPLGFVFYMATLKTQMLLRHKRFVSELCAWMFLINMILALILRYQQDTHAIKYFQIPGVRSTLSNKDNVPKLQEQKVNIQHKITKYL